MTGWPVVVIAIATSVMAVAALVLFVGLGLALRQLAVLSKQMSRVIETLQRDGTPAIESVRRTAEEAGRVAVIREKTSVFPSRVTSIPLLVPDGTTGRIFPPRPLTANIIVEACRSAFKEESLAVWAPAERFDRGVKVLGEPLFRAGRAVAQNQLPLIGFVAGA